MNRNEFAQCMAPLVAAIGKPLAPDQARVYFEMLADLSVEQLRVGVARTLCEHEFFTVPSIATLRRLSLERNESDAVVKASEMVLACRKFAFYEPERVRQSITDPRAMLAMEAIGGVSRLADLTPDSLAAYAAQFRGAYESLHEAGRVSDVRQGLGLNSSQRAIAALAKNLESKLEGT